MCDNLFEKAHEYQMILDVKDGILGEKLLWVSVSRDAESNNTNKCRKSVRQQRDTNFSKEVVNQVSDQDVVW